MAMAMANKRKTQLLVIIIYYAIIVTQTNVFLHLHLRLLSAAPDYLLQNSPFTFQYNLIYTHDTPQPSKLPTLINPIAVNLPKQQGGTSQQLSSPQDSNLQSKNTEASVSFQLTLVSASTSVYIHPRPSQIRISPYAYPMNKPKRTSRYAKMSWMVSSWEEDSNGALNPSTLE